MNVSAVPGFVPAPHAFVRPEKGEKPDGISEESPINDAEEIEEVEASSEKKPGVLRLLEEGHFKGVAELRHRIRFHEELSARAEEEAGTVLSEGADDLVGSVTEGVKSLAASLREIDEPAATDGEMTESADTLTAGSLLDDFENAVASAVGGDENVAVNLEAVADDLKSAFDSLVVSLQSLYAEPVEEEPAVVDSNPELTQEPGRAGRETLLIDPSLVIGEESQTVPDEVEETETTFASRLLDEAIASMTASFEEALAALMAEAEETLRLDDPAPAPGNGVAFAKFLAIYDSLRGVEQSTIDEAA